MNIENLNAVTELTRELNEIRDAIGSVVDGLDVELPNGVELSEGAMDAITSIVVCELVRSESAIVQELRGLGVTAATEETDGLSDFITMLRTGQI